MAARCVEADVRGDVIEPRGERLGPAQGAERAEGAQEYLLRQIFGLGRVAADAIGDIVDLTRVAVEQRFERILLPLHGACDKLGIRAVAPV